MIRFSSVIIGGLVGAVLGIILLYFLVPLAFGINLDSDLMTIYPDPGQPVTILEKKGD